MRLSSARKRGRSAGRCPANCGWSCGNPARRPNDSCQTGARGCSATRRAPPSVAASSAPAPTTIAGRSAQASSSASASTAAGIGRRRPHDASAGAASWPVSGRGGPVVHRHDDDRRARFRSRPRGTRGRRPRDVLRAHRLVDPHRVVARQALQPSRPGTARARDDGGPAGRRARRAARGSTRAVASAPTALPSPGVVCRSASAGSPRAIAQPVAMPTTDPSCSASTNSRSSGSPVRNGTSVDPGLANRVVRPRSRRTSTTASRTVVPGTRSTVNDLTCRSQRLPPGPALRRTTRAPRRHAIVVLEPRGDRDSMAKCASRPPRQADVEPSTVAVQPEVRA